LRAFEPAGEIPSEVEGALRTPRIFIALGTISGSSTNAPSPKIAFRVPVVARNTPAPQARNYWAHPAGERQRSREGWV